MLINITWRSDVVCSCIIFSWCICSVNVGCFLLIFRW